MNKPIELVVDEELVLREFSLEDAETIFALIDRNREHLSQNRDVTAQKYPDIESVKKSIEEPKNPNKLRLGIWDGQTYTGTINLTPEGETAEIGCYLGQEFQGNGYIARSAQTLLRYASDKGIKEVFAKIQRTNTKSLKAAKRAGFIEDQEKSTEQEFYMILKSD